MELRTLVTSWFEKWESGDFMNLPISENFKHTSPFGSIEGKEAYLELVSQNKDKFLGQSFDIHDMIFEKDRACVRYTASQGKDFSLEVSEWYYAKDLLIDEIIAYYHIGEIRDDRKIDNYNEY